MGASYLMARCRRKISDSTGHRQDHDRKNGRKGTNQQRNAIADKTNNRIVLVKAYKVFHRWCFKVIVSPN